MRLIKANKCACLIEFLQGHQHYGHVVLFSNLFSEHIQGLNIGFSMLCDIVEHSLNNNNNNVNEGQNV